MAYRHDTATCQVFDGAEWQPIGGAATDGASLWGVNAAADDTNRLVVAAPASLFTHDGGDHRLAINKAGNGDTAALLFQTAWSGRAEIGLAGSDDLALRVSEDGSAWRSGVIIGGDGRASLPFPSPTIWSSTVISPSTSGAFLAAALPQALSGRIVGRRALRGPA